jgi:hypothetical protein
MVTTRELQTQINVLKEQLEMELRHVKKNNKDLSNDVKIKSNRKATGSLPEFFDITLYSVAIFFGNWLFGHLLKDFDDAAWNKTKETFKEIFIPAKKNKEDNKKIAFVINVGRNIVFLFSKKMTLKEFEDAFIKIKKVLKKINKKDLNEPYSPLIFEFNTSQKRWKRVLNN